MMRLSKMMQAYIDSLGFKKEKFMNTDVTNELHKKIGTVTKVEDCDKKGYFLITYRIDDKFLKKYEQLLVTPPIFPESICKIT